MLAFTKLPFKFDILMYCERQTPGQLGLNKQFIYAQH